MSVVQRIQPVVFLQLILILVHPILIRKEVLDLLYSKLKILLKNNEEIACLPHNRQKKAIIIDISLVHKRKSSKIKEISVVVGSRDNV
jgi:hypothetical protein